MALPLGGPKDDIFCGLLCLSPFFIQVPQLYLDIFRCAFDGGARLGVCQLFNYMFPKQDVSNTLSHSIFISIDYLGIQNLTKSIKHMHVSVLLHTFLFILKCILLYSQAFGVHTM